MGHDFKDVAAKEAGARNCRKLPSIGPTFRAIATALLDVTK